MNGKKIGTFIAKLRKEKNMTQEDLANSLFVDRATVSKWETGNYIANPEILLKLSNIFKVSVNEILLGERKTKENIEEVNKITVDILKKNKMKIKKILIISITIFILLFIYFLIYYFFNNYNSISVYKITGDNGNFKIEDSLFIVSNEKAYLLIDEVKPKIPAKEEKVITDVSLKFTKNNKDKLIVNLASNKIGMNINIFGYDSLFSYSDLEFIKRNSFIEVQFIDGKIEKIPLKFTKEYSNNNIFSYHKSSKITIDNDYLIPDYIKKQFKYNRKHDNYSLNKKVNGIKTEQEYYVDDKFYTLIEDYQKYRDYYDYEVNNGWIIGNRIIGADNIVDSFSYDLKNKECKNGNCDINKIKHFVNDYLIPLGLVAEKENVLN